MVIGIDARMFQSQFTGIGRYVFELTRNLFEIDHNNSYVLFMNEPTFSSFAPANERVSKVLVGARHYSLVEQTKFLGILNRYKLDLMHFTHFNTPILYRRPFVVTIHDLTLTLFPGKKMTSWVHRLGYHLILSSTVKRARMIIALSQHTSSDLVRFFRIGRGKIKVIYGGVDPMFRQVEGVDQIKFLKRPFFLYTGVWRDHKNLVRLIKAFHLLVNEGLDANLVITGREDPFYPEVKATVDELKLNERVHLTGLVDEKTLVQLYNAARVYVFPSLYEGFGLPPLESFACGTPVCASQAASIPEICGDAALYFDPYNIEEMACQMKKLWKDDTLRTRLIAEGLKRVRQFSWRKMAEETLEVYNKIFSISYH